MYLRALEFLISKKMSSFPEIGELLRIYFSKEYSKA